MAVKRKTGLGRGLSALMADVSPVVEDTNIEKQEDTELSGQKILPIEYIERNKSQPREYFDEEALVELSNSIREKGLLQPILVREFGADKYEIVAGERRWRASQLAGIHEVPVVVKELDDQEVLEIAIIENIQRQELNPVEEAKGYGRLINDFGHTQEIVAKVVGKSRSHITNLLRLLKLPQSVVGFIEAGKLSMGHARALVGSPDPEALAKVVISKGLNVRQTENLANLNKGNIKQPGSKPPSNIKRTKKDADTVALEKDLTAALGGMKVSIDHQGEGGTVMISYRDLDDLDDLCSKLGVCGI